MNEEGAGAEAVRYWWGEALESLAAAHRELDAGDYTFAINRAYYASFYAVSALLLEEGSRFGKHGSVRAAFNRDIIKPGRLGGEHGKLYNELFRARQEGDYLVFTKFDASYVQEKVDAREQFLADIRPLIQSLPPDKDTPSSE